MKNHVLAKIFGWGQFGLNLFQQFATSGVTPHGAIGWFQFGASLASAIGIHAASNTPGPDPNTKQ